MEWVYLSPHLDDVALSCGGLVWEQVQAGRSVSIWTICAADPPDEPLSPYASTLHTRWQAGRDATRLRRAEDRESVEQLGAAAVHFPVPDCIYRRSPQTGLALYQSEEAIFGPLDPAEEGLVKTLSDELKQRLPGKVELVCPLALGGHVDHRLVRASAELLGLSLWYYADYPYAKEAPDVLDRMRRSGWQPFRFPVSADGLDAWVRSVAAHTSQLSTFWEDMESMRSAVRMFCEQMDGVTLWRKNGA